MPYFLCSQSVTYFVFDFFTHNNPLEFSQISSHLISVDAITVGSMILRSYIFLLLMHLHYFAWFYLLIFILSVEVFAVFMWDLNVVKCIIKT